MEIENVPIDEFESAYFEYNQRKALALPNALKSEDYLEYLVETFLNNPHELN